jgi:hypothetical protein
MAWIAEIIRWRDDRHRLAKLRFDLEDVEAAFKKKVEAGKLRRGAEGWDEVYGDFDANSESIHADIDEIETRNHIRRAKAWAVPIPHRPISQEPVYGDKYWVWCRVHGRYYLNDEGKALLRREANVEMEMFYKPWLSWAALGMSVISLTISVLKS